MISKKYLESVTAFDPVEIVKKETAVERKRIGNTGVYWSITKDGTLIVSGKGDPCIDADYKECIPWFEYGSSIKSVVIEKGVTPKSVSYWFYGCTSLVKAPVIPEGVVDCAGMFEGCTSLVKAPVIPKGVLYSEYMFSDCTSLAKAPVVPEGVKDCESMFRGCTSLKKPPTIPPSVKFCEQMFEGCTSLEKSPV